MERFDSCVINGFGVSGNWRGL